MPTTGITLKFGLYLIRTNEMLVIRLYIAVLTVGLMCALSFTRRIGILEAVVIVCPILFMILDMQFELREFKQLETRVSDYLDRS